MAGPGSVMLKLLVVLCGLMALQVASEAQMTPFEQTMKGHQSVDIVAMRAAA